MSRDSLSSIAVILGATLLVGCSGAQSRLAAPGVAADAGEEAISQFDNNGDGALGGEELQQVPSIKSSLNRTDQNGDGKITADEIDARVAVWKNSGLALTRLAVTVLKNGSPVSNADVTLVPAEFLGPAIKAAKGTTDSEGVAHMRISKDPDESGVHLGYYRVEVSKKDAAGSETLPESNNTATQHGVEVTPDDPRVNRLTVNLLNE